ncbi:acyl-CoA dehydrogenase [Halopolyspora algeriensis]|uniref:Acyl-CoA dehydrogenase n=1 Tax=Halopolyspora algeriensis TaxID=1500506 RepID=A0A368VS56_9ACTN|nr:acyl-CoA dehydrogenase family protein [Halopolyspora algeriensis]RCW44539.1 acyl-CoA dehydrogenase [Halopolyspora algeriensis]TQM55899.1 acyl-CoA dehydrogenase [Halopolyspora algeriensis]
MDFSPTEAQQDLAGLTTDILADHVTDARLRELDSDSGRFDRALWKELGRAGVLGATLPPDVGGAGFGLLEQCSVLIEMGRATAPVPYLSSVVLAAATLARFGTREQRDRWAVPAGAGETVLTAAMVEEGSADPRTPSTRADRSGEHWVLNGTKTTVPAGPVADLVLVPATTPEGPAVFLVAPGDRGVTLESQRVTGAGTEAWLELSEVSLAQDRVLGGVEHGPQILDLMLRHGTIGLCAGQLGVLERALELTAEYARDRVQFGHPIGGFQAVAQRLADAYIDVEAVRLTMWQAAWLASHGLPCDTEAATAKFWAAEGGHRVAHTAVHVHGGVGIDLDHHLHRYFVAAKYHEFTLGAATAQLGHIGRTLAAEAIEE